MEMAMMLRKDDESPSGRGHRAGRGELKKSQRILKRNMPSDNDSRDRVFEFEQRPDVVSASRATNQSNQISFVSTHLASSSIYGFFLRHQK
jgi:hypothetical protein